MELRCPKCGGERLREVGENHYLCRGCGHEFYACPLCGEAFAHQRQLAGHMRAHRRPGEREVLEELRALSEEIRTVQVLLEEALAAQRLILAKLDQVLELQERALNLPPRAAPLAAPAPAEEGTADEDLPDFLRGNPWLRLLSVRTEGGEGGA